MTLQLSVLDQSFSRSAAEAQQALQETLEMARFCEQLGFKRFWVSEHHAFPTVAGSAPEVLIAALGAATQSIRLGSGGVMLPHYSPYKIAEVFSLLANLYPGRVDLGVGRAPGADMETARALAVDGRPRFERFPEQLSQLGEHLYNRSAKPLLSPQPPEDIPLWVLGSSPDSAVLAAQRGLPYNLGVFINPMADPALIKYYKRNFQPSAQQTTAYAILTLGVFCADTEQQARAMQATFDINFFRFITGQSQGEFLTPEEASHYPVSPQLQAFMAERDNYRAVGTPQQVKEKITRLAEQFDADEVMAVSNMYYLEDRKRCFELLMSVFSN